jgi:cytochrome b561
MLALLALHIIGIIKHKVMDRDNLLPRMGWGRST